MLDRIIRFSLNNRVLVVVIMAALMIWGCLTLFRTEVDIFPDLNAPTVVVMTEAGGLAPEEVEKLVTLPIETALNGASGVRRVRSSSSTGFSVVWVEFDWNADYYHSRQIVSEKLSTLSDKLPANVGEPTLGPESSILGEMLIIGLTSDSIDLMQLRLLADRTIAPRLLALGGVSQVSVIGGDVAEIQIRLLPDRMKYFNVSLDEVSEAAAQLNDNASGGIIYDYGNEYIVKGDLHTTDTYLIAKAVVKSDANGVVTLGDVANVEIGPESPRLGLASECGKGAVLLTVTKQRGAGTIQLTEEIEQTLNQLRASLPSDIRISTDIFRQSDFIDTSISNLKMSLLEGSFFVIIILFIFLMNYRTTLISVLALPLSIIITVLVLHLMGFTINTMSLGGIAIAIGSLVDDAIVDVENVYRRLRHNRTLPEGARKSVSTVVFEASREVRLPILNSTLIIIASFLPLFFLSGIEGRLLYPLGISFVVALLASTLVALTITPILCSYLLGKKGKTPSSTADDLPRLARRMSIGYANSLNGSLKRRKSILGGCVALLGVALALLPTIGRSFLPPFNEGSLTINVSTLPGISLEESDKIGAEAERIILSMPEISTVARKTGRAELDEHSLGVNTSEIEAPYQLQDRSKETMVAELREKLSHLPGTNIEIGQPISHRIDAMLSGTESQIAIKIFGDDLNRLYQKAMEVKRAISTVDGIVDVNVEQQIGRPQIEIRPRRDMLARYGITPGQFAAFVQTMLSGKVVSQVFEGGIPYNVTLKLDGADDRTIDDLKNLSIDSNQGKIPFNLVADIVSTTGPNTINRENVSRRIVVSANVSDGDLTGAVNEIRRRIEHDVEMPQGYYVVYGGQFENEAKASNILLLASLGALLIILMLLLNEYRSWRQSLIILVNMPMALIGGILILVLTGSQLNIPAIIGFISLMGISTRNGMLLMSRFNALAAEGMPLKQRILKGASDRLNPIIMTALTSALALIPIAVRGAEPGNEIQAPMALVILGGLLTSTVLNIFVVPILYFLSNKQTNSK